MSQVPRLGIFVPEWRAAVGRPLDLSGDWIVMTVHPDLAAVPAPIPVARVDLAAVLDRVRAQGGGARLMHLRHAVEAMDCESAAIDGLLRTAVLEYPDLIVRSVRLDGTDAVTAIAKEPRLEARGFQQVLWRDGRRFERAWHEAEDSRGDGADMLAAEGTVLITGGLGGVGRHIAEHLAARPGVRLALAGRSALDASAKFWIGALPVRAIYFQADLADRSSTAALITEVEQQLGPMVGVVHAAGHLEDAWIANTTPAALTRVLTKAHGALNLDAALADHASLRWFVLCSSLAGTLGHAGQGAYAAANAWVDHMAEARERLRLQGRRFGVTRAIAWPLWADGGMRPAPETLRALSEAGVRPLPTSAAMTALNRIVAGTMPTAAVLWGDATTAAQRLGLTLAPPPAAKQSDMRGQDQIHSVDALIAVLAPLAEQLLKLPAGRLDPDRPLSAYGFDSITLTRFSTVIRDNVGGSNLAPATFLDHPTLRALATHLAGQIQELPKFVEISAKTSSPAEPIAVSARYERRAPVGLGAFSLLERVIVRQPAPSPDTPRRNRHGNDVKVAVVGIGCRFPDAESAMALWQNLCDGRRAIVRVPADRWDWRAVDGDPAAPGNRTDCHFGGFIDDVASFDAALFGLSDDEARAMDPQHRLVLEAAWAMLEDAGLGPDALNGRKVGAFVGVQRQEYQARLAAETMTGGVNTGNSHAMLVNRLSYLFGWTGPSFAIDTGCSGSAVAIHQAVRALQSGECSHAVAGGVNVVLAPESVIVNRRMGLLTGSDTVRPFDAAADGHLFADGVGLILLRRLDDAVADGDFIYGVIAGSAANHNGEAMYLTAPSPRGQAEVMREAMTRAGLKPEDLDYVEGQGAANTLVDGAELEAYRQVFGDNQYAMPLGSLKGHLGHLESASGVAALIKVLMAMRSGVLPPTLGHETLNWDASRGPASAKVVTHRQAWPAGKDRVRRAGVHNFGYGGANVHLVVESAPPITERADGSGVVVVPISAPSTPQLRIYAADLARFLKSESWRAYELENLRLADLAFTLQVGRRPQAVRAAFSVSSLAELVIVLERCATEAEAASLPFGHPVSAWISGGVVDWTVHRGAGPHRRLPLPGMPFARRRFWPTAATTPPGAVAAYYDTLAHSVPQLDAREEMNLLFAPLPERPAGFSWLRTLFLPEEKPEHFHLFLDRQRAMKARLFDRIDLTRVRRVMDIGCGFATDLLQLAGANPSLSGRGFTIAPAQAAVAARRIDEASFGGRLEVLARDSARDDLGGPYDLMIGFEVTFHVADKAGLFANIARNLADDGDLLLIDCVAETAGEINMPEIGQFTPTSDAFAQILAEHGLSIVHADDASGGIANFLRDPDFEMHLTALHARLPALAERAGEHRGWANFGKALGLGLLRYVLLHVRKDRRDVGELAAHNRRALAQALPYGAPRPVQVQAEPVSLAGGSVEQRIAIVTAALAEMDAETLPREARFAALGITSLKGLLLVDALSRHLGVPVRMTDLFDYPSVRALAAHLSTQLPSPVATEIAAPAVTRQFDAKTYAARGLPSFATRSTDIAIIGLAARFPGAEDIGAFWHNLRNGVDSVGPMPPMRRALTRTATDHAAGFIEGVELFDPLFFRLTPREAEAMDPQQRLFLEQCWHALEDAGIAPSRLRGFNCGVVAGVQPSEYGDLFGEQAFDSHAAQLLLGNAASILASRIAYLLDLKGPAISLDTACSSSLVAVHQAAHMLRDGQADLMLAGGVSLFLSDKPFRMMERAGMLAPGGRCRPFSGRADGIAVAEGAGVVVLKRLGEALADGDRIWGIIRGSAINQDGATNGITAPSRDSQRRLAQAALKDAGLKADAVDYVEAHGTGTALGDPIEFAALSDVYGNGRTETINLGAVKSNIGHASAASGVAGLTKVLLALAHDAIPPTLHLDTVNPHINLDQTPFRIPVAPEPWRRALEPRRAAVNSLGFSGTNCHLLVEEAPVRGGMAARPGNEVFPLSARTDTTLRAAAVALAEYLSGEGRDLAPASVAATLQSGREAHGRRLAVVADNLADVANALTTFAETGASNAMLTIGTASDDALDDLVGGAAGAAFVQALVDARDLKRLGRLWCQGVGVDWTGVRDGPRPAPVWLPPYPFERLRCWLDMDAPASVQGPVAEVLSRPALLRPVWRQTGIVEAARFAGRVVVVGDGAWTGLADALGAELVPPGAVDGLIQRLDAFAAILDVGLDVALEARHELWRALASRRDGPRLLTVRPEGIEGAFAGGIAAALGGECAALWTREMQVGDMGRMAPAVLAAIIRSELGSDDGLSRVLWRNGVRHRPSFEEVVTPERPAIDLTMAGDGPVLITGGLGGLGLALAQHLVKRGVKVLALAGLRKMQSGDARSLAVDALRAQRAIVEVYAGDLRDDAFEVFVANVRKQYGSIRGAVHAAGRVGEGARAYQSRDFAQVLSVMEPKADGLHALRRALGDDPLAFLVSYSSISASIPSLAGGLVDYAAANAELEAEAQAAFGLGQRYERAIAWGNWTESGLGLASVDKLRPLGLAGLSDAEGVVLFEQALAIDAPVVLATGLRPGADTLGWSLSRGTRAAVHANSALPARAVTASTIEVDSKDSSAAMLSWLSGVFGRELRLPAAELDAERRFEDYGIDSILLADLVLALERELGVKLEPGLLIEHRTLRQLAAHLATLHVVPAGAFGAAAEAAPLMIAPAPSLRTASAIQTTDRRVAVIGLACDFPGAPDAQRFWANLSTGVDSISEVPPDRWNVSQFYDRAGGSGRSIGKWGGFIDDIALFDPAYFGIAPEDAASLDPLVRKALEVAVQTLRDAGYADADVKGSRTGVFIGARMSDYGARTSMRRKRALTGSAQNFIAAQLAHCLDLHGPNLVVDTACSSSLTAVHLAVRSLIEGDSELALAGGVDLLLDETPYIGLTAGQALSPNGRCKTFDESADGFVPGEGAGIVLLKRLDRALADGDRVLAVIEGSAVNNDGRTMGLTTPNPEAQEAVIRQALTNANAVPTTVSYVEAHGTGTMIGDPIELKALWRALGDDGARGRCAVGAVKSNIGHLLSAAGIASLIKVVLMLRHRTLAPTLHCASPNPRFAFDRSPLRLVTRAEPWQGVESVRRAGVSSFGFGGTNVHVVLSDHGVPQTIGRQPLSPQAFNRQRYWIEKTLAVPAIAASSSYVHPAALPLREVASASGRHFVTSLPPDHPILRDHVVQGVGIAPGTMHFDLVHRALSAIDGQIQAGMALRQIVFREPAARIEGAARRLDLRLTPRGEDWDVEVTGGPDRNIHLQAVAARTTPQLGAAISIADLQAQATVSFDLTDAYSLARKVGIVHGDFMRAQGTVWGSADFLLARLSVSDVARDAASCFALHPALLDALCLVPFLFERHRATAETRPFIPISIGAFEVSGALPTEGWVLVRRAGAGGLVPEDVYHADIGLYRVDGTPAARMTRLAAKRIRVPLNVAAEKTLAIAVPAIASPAAASVASESALRNWLTRYMSSVLGQPIDSDAMEVGFYDLGLDSRQLLEAVRVLERGLGEDLYPTLLFEQGSVGRLAAYLWSEHRAGVGRLLASGATIDAGGGGVISGPIPAGPGAPSDTLYIGRNWSAAPIGPPRAMAGKIIQSGQKLNVSWLGGFTSDPNMAAGALFGWRGRQDVAQLLTLAGRLPGDAALVVSHDGDPEGAGLHGLLASVSRERPGLRLVCVENDHAADPVAELETATPGFVAVRYRAGVREILGFAEVELSEASLPAGGCWLIAGGLGQLGLHLARALAARGARVGLLGRRPPSSELAAELADLDIVWTTGDVSERASLAAALDVLRARLVPFTGVIHAAGVLRDGLAMAGVSERDAAAVLAPKISGAEHLDALTRDDPMQHFVLFSSATGSLGSVGQGVYGYANGWLDGFAATRSGPGRTISIGWPLWADGGMRGDALEAARHGVVPLGTHAGLAAFGAALAGEVSHLVVLHGDGAKLREGLRPVQHHDVPAPAVHRAAPTRTDEAVAVIGLAGRYPGAKDIDSFWRNLVNGVDAVTEVPKDRWDHAAYFDASGEAPGTTWSRWGGFIDGVDQFDPLFFHIAPREARVMDPQERLFLETAWAAMEDAAIARETLAGRKVGVFAGVMWSQYQLYGLAAAKDGAHLLPMSFNSSVANRVSHVLDLRGPSLSLDTACSSSLTALHLAVESLRRGECDLAFAGGVNLTLHPSKYQFLGQGRMLSSDGRCRAFGEGGDGYVPGEGVGVALLKPLSQAQADGDPIWGVILASGISHGGRTAGYTVPSAGRQQDLIGDVLASANIKPAEISYIEAHGTGTSLGDPIEVEGLKGAFGAVAPEPWCGLGSVKSNIGHLESAAGIAGLTKVLLQLRHRQLAPTLHADPLNAHLAIAGTPFRVQNKHTPWHAVGQRIAGLSSFGAGGANAHLLIGEAPNDVRATRETTSPELIVLSARTPSALRQRVSDLLRWIDEAAEPVDVAALAYTLQAGRSPMAARLTFIASNVEEIRASLRAFMSGQVPAVDTQMPLADSARRFLAGETIEWNALRSAPYPQRIGSLPVYPFEHKRYWTDAWLDSAPPRVAGAVHTGAKDAETFRALRKRWHAAPLPAASGEVWPDGLIVLAGPASRALSTPLAPDAVVPVLQGWDEGRAAAENLLSFIPGALTVIDLADLDAVPRDSDELDLGRIAFLQTLIRQRPASLRILHLTRGLAVASTLKGAAMAGLVRMLGAEHPGVMARTVDGDLALEDGAAWMNMLGRELSADDPVAEVRIRNGERFVPAMEASPLGADAPLRCEPDAAYLITGGTSGIGLALAHALVDAGATKLALMGRQTLPVTGDWARVIADAATDPHLREKLVALAALRDRGVAVLVHGGVLTDGAGVTAFLARVRSELGLLAGLVHAAGLIGEARPRFVDKGAEDFARVTEPKIAGLNTLLAALVPDRLRFVVLCSSIAAAVPAMAASMSDYASANAYMDALAEHRAVRDDGTLWLSLQWVGWSEAGMHTRFDTAVERIVRDGLGAYGLEFCDNRAGASLFGRLLAAGISGPVVPAPANVERLEAALPDMLHVMRPPAVREETLRLEGQLQDLPALCVLSEDELDRMLARFDTDEDGANEDTSALEARIDLVRRIVAEVLELELEELAPDTALRDVGIDSIAAVRVVQRLEENGLVITPKMLIDHPTPRALVVALNPGMREAAE